MTKVPTERDAYEHGASRASRLTGHESGVGTDEGFAVSPAIRKIVDAGARTGSADAWARQAPKLDPSDVPVMDSGGRW
jgi:hypothetical protein